MKILEVKKETFKGKHPDLDEVSARLDNHGSEELIDIINWGNYNYKPGVSFNIAYNNREIFLKYYVHEESVKAEKTKSNQRVYEDSCVEFFVSPDNDGIYYNFEFNAIGTCLLGIGTCRGDRTLAPASLIRKIRRKSTWGRTPFKERIGDFSWTITIAIPAEIFFRHSVNELKGKIFRANFYKCGDTLNMPHYLTWNPVATKKPDYHQPDFFGVLKFV